VVVIRLAGNRIMLLKRVLAMEGDVIEFRQGRLFLNRQPVSEPYVQASQAWHLPPRKIDPGHVYVVGDNRRVPMHIHQLGQASRARIRGAPLW
jgi:signal peptidase I